jgi:hypothetical protein
MASNGLVKPQEQVHKWKYRRWQRHAPMQLWRLDIIGGIPLADGRSAKLVTGIDDHSRFIVVSAVVMVPSGRATRSSNQTMLPARSPANAPKACCSGMSHPQTAPASRSGGSVTKASRSSLSQRGIAIQDHRNRSWRYQGCHLVGAWRWRVRSVPTPVKRNSRRGTSAIESVASEIDGQNLDHAMRVAARPFGR